MDHCTLFLIALGLACCSSTVTAERLFQWQDENGQQHFSDVPPAGQLTTERELRYAAPYHRENSSLRPGERDTLRTLTQRASRQSRDSKNLRARNDRLVAKKRKTCRNDRNTLNTTRSRETRKLYTEKLRKNCW